MSETPQQAARRLSKKAIADGYKPQALHEYTDLDGRPIHWRIRLKNTDTGEKWIRPMMRVGAGFVLKEPPYLDGKPLYRLHELASRTHEPVIVVEGEPCADALAKLGILATTSGAADSADRADWSILAGSIATIWPDADEAGARYAQAVKDALEAIGCTVAVIDVAKLSLPPKGDCVDWLAMNPSATAADIHALPRIGLPESTHDHEWDASDSQTPQENAPDPDNESDGAIITRLAALPKLEYDRVRNETAKVMGVRPATLDSLVKDALKDKEGERLPFKVIETWHEPISPAELLTEIANTIRRFIVLDKEQADAATLWVAFTHFIDVVEVAPLAIINAPEKACGKSQLLTLFGRLVSRPLPAANSSISFLFRAVELWTPTMLIDEADTFIKENEELKGLVNAGHTRANAFVGRVVGDDLKPKLFTVWGAKALAGIALEKHLPDATLSRAIIISMRRKLPDEKVIRLRYAEAGSFDRLASMLARFAEDYAEKVRTARPHLPHTLSDRAQDNWEPLLAIAECAGSEWVERATQAALKLSNVSTQTQSAGNELLSDIQHVFESKRVEKISMSDLVATLVGDEEAAWATWNKSRPLTPRQLGRMLASYGIQSKTIRIGYEVSKGFYLEQFADTFVRYLSTPPENAIFSVTRLQANEFKASSVTGPSVTNPVGHTPVTPEPPWIKPCNQVTKKPIFAEAEEMRVDDVEFLSPANTSLQQAK